MESLRAIRAGTEEEKMIEVEAIIVTSLARIQDMSNDLIEILVFEAKVLYETMRKEITGIEIEDGVTEDSIVIDQEVNHQVATRDRTQDQRSLVRHRVR